LPLSSISTCTDNLIDRKEFIQNEQGVEESKGESEDEPFRGPTDDLHNEANELEQQHLSEAMWRSAASAAEEEQIRGMLRGEADNTNTENLIDLCEAGSDLGSGEMDEQHLSEAMMRSTESAAEVEQIREVLKWSLESQT
jgi:hypothetical protein